MNRMASSLGYVTVRHVIMPRGSVASPPESGDPQRLAGVTHTHVYYPTGAFLQIILLATLILAGLSIGLAHAQRYDREGNDKYPPGPSTLMPLEVTGWGWPEEDKRLPALATSVHTLGPVDCAVVTASVVGFETSKGQLPDDLSDFLASLMVQGYSLGTVDMTAGPIPDCVDILIVHGLANNQALSEPYTASEGDTLKAWVASGHGLMLSGDWGNFKTGTQALFQTYGYSQLGGVVRDPTDFDPNGPFIDPAIWVIYQNDNFANHPILSGIDSLQLQASSWLDMDTDAILTTDADANPASMAVMAAFQDGTGCVFLSTDSNWAATDGGAGGYSKHDNARVANQVINWLEGCSSLTLAKLAVPNPVQPGAILTYTLTAANNLTTTINGGIITDIVPINTTFLSATLPYNGPDANQVITWPLGVLNPGDSNIVQMTVLVDSEVLIGTAITNTAWVASDEGLTDSAAISVDVSSPTPPPVSTNTPTPIASATPAATPTPSSTTLPTNTPTASSTPLPAPASAMSYLPVILRTSPSFPLFIGPAIPGRPVGVQGEIFYSTTVQVPAQLPMGGRFYFSSTPDQANPVVVDDDLAIVFNGVDQFAYHFSSIGHPPQPAIVELPHTVVESLTGQEIVVEYRDVYGVLVDASPIWLIWVP